MPDLFALLNIGKLQQPSSICYALLLSICCMTSLQARQIDQIIAIVEDGVILESELNQKLLSIRQQIAAEKNAPPESYLKQQVLERLIMDQIQLQLAKRSGLVVSEELVKHSMAQIAEQNNLSSTEFRAALSKEGIGFTSFEADLRTQLMIDQLRNREVRRRIKISEQEVDHYLKARGGSVLKQNNRYRLGHILLPVPEDPSPAELKDAMQKASTLVSQLRSGAEFKELAILNSISGQAANGGDLGWRTVDKIPSLFADFVTNMNPGDIHEPLMSPSGCHIVKLLEMKGEANKTVTQSHARHILIKTNAVFGDEVAKRKIMALVEHLDNGADFADLAKAHSEDKMSALNGGDLNWVNPGTMVREFETAMDTLQVNQISEPIKTQFGWHLIQVLERRESTDSNALERTAARQDLSRQKMDEETRLWLRELRDEAYVEIRI